MSGQLTTFGETQILNWLNAQTVTQPTALFVALFTAAPTAAGGGTEVSSTNTGYARQPAGLALSEGTTPAQLANQAAIAFGPATADWGEIVDVAIFDAATGGNMWAFGTLNNSAGAPTPQTVSSGGSFSIPAGQLTAPLT